MFKWLVLLAVVSCASAQSAEDGVAAGSHGTSCKCGWANKNEKRIVGGTFYEKNKYPFIAGVARVNNVGCGYYPTCGGTIITPNHVITTAHCTDDVIRSEGKLIVLLGTHDRSKPSATDVTIPVAKINQHPAYRSDIRTVDISILTLSSPITFNTIIGPLCMPQPGLNVTGETVRILGWGSEGFRGSITLKPKSLDTTVITNAACSLAWGGVSTTSPTQICTHSEGGATCWGDTGGPVVWLDPQTNRYTFVGIVSYGPACNDKAPEVHTSVEAYLPWIETILRAASTTKNVSTCVKV